MTSTISWIRNKALTVQPKVLVWETVRRWCVSVKIISAVIAEAKTSSEMIFIRFFQALMYGLLQAKTNKYTHCTTQKQQYYTFGHS